MLFNSLPFLYLFLPITYVVFWRLRARSHRYLWLTLTGYLFYGFWNYRYCALMLFSTIVSYLAGLGFLHFNSARARRSLLIVPIVIDLTLLGYFKYANLLLTTANDLILAGRARPLPLLDVVLPIGISFYTFHTITYVVDSYKGRIQPTRNFFEFSTYVSLFAQLVAGPIVRFREIEADLERIDASNRAENMQDGWSFFAIGLSKKVLIADTIATIINAPLDSGAPLSTVATWLCMLGYTIQIYFDFSGYSDMAVGLGRLFGLRLPRNFDSPYKAVDIADFWRRWHISLSSFLRDYLYIPLGGSRTGTAASYRNLMITMLLGGLWHGASWTFVAWGAYHGALLCLNRAAHQHIHSIPIPIRRAVTFIAVVIGWVFFRAATFHQAAVILGRMFRWSPGPGVIGGPLLIAVLAVAIVITQIAPNTFEMNHRWSRPMTLGIGALVLTSLFVIYAANPSPFLYFQF